MGTLESSGHACLDSRNFLANQSFGDLGHDPCDGLIGSPRGQALDDSTGHFIDEAVSDRHRRCGGRSGKRWCGRNRFALLDRKQRSEHVRDKVTSVYWCR